MNSKQGEVEAYAKTSDTGAVISLLSRTIGTLTTDCKSGEFPRIYTFEGTTVVLGASEDGFLSVWIRGATMWPTSSAFGRCLAAQLDCVVRCDPGREFPAVSPYSNVFLQIERGAESFVAWG